MLGKWFRNAPTCYQTTEECRGQDILSTLCETWSKKSINSTETVGTLWFWSK